MNLTIRCSTCGKSYVCYQGNTRIYGPLIVTVCPECKTELTKNFSSFLKDQTDNDGGRLRKAVSMITLGQSISRIVNEERAFTRRKRK